jgi:uncharacterized membrane protein YfcA
MDILFDLSPLNAAFGSVLTGAAICFLLGLAVGFIAAMFGIGGGFVVTPFFHSVLQLPATLAVASSMGQIAFMSLSGIVEYARKKKIVYREGLLLLAGAIPASQTVALTFGNLRDSTVGTQKLFANMTVADFILLLGFGFFLGLVGIYNLYRSFGYPDGDSKRGESPGEIGNASPGDVRTRPAPVREDATPPIIAERALRIRRRPVATILVGCVFGALSALLGIGGGFFAVPFFVFALKFEPAEAVATSFFCILVTAVLTTLHYALAGNIYLGLSLCIALGSVVGAQGGSRFAIRIAPARLLISLGCAQLAIVAAYVALKVF